MQQTLVVLYDKWSLVLKKISKEWGVMGWSSYDVCSATVTL